MNDKAIFKNVFLCSLLLVVPFMIINFSISMNTIFIRIAYPKSLVSVVIVLITFVIVVAIYRLTNDRLVYIAIVILLFFLINILSDFRLTRLINTKGLEFAFIFCSLWDISALLVYDWLFKKRKAGQTGMVYKES